MVSIAGVDTSAWVQVGGTAAGAYYQVGAEPVLVAVPVDGYMQTEAGALKSLSEFERLAREMNQPMAVIILVDRVASQDAASRRVWAERADPRLHQGLALVCSSLLSRAIGSFFMGLNRPKVPTRMFGTYPEALEWAREMVRAARGSS
jgi:hypothetical protein